MYAEQVDFDCILAYVYVFIQDHPFPFFLLALFFIFWSHAPSLALPEVCPTVSIHDICRFPFFSTLAFISAHIICSFPLNIPEET